MTTLVRMAVSPDADDLFMVRALLDGAIDTSPYRFVVDTSPTDALNRLASGAEGPEVVALSAAHYPRVADRYRLLPHGGSMGEGYGPVVVARAPATLADLHDRPLAIPGATTTAWMVLRLLLPEGVRPRPVEIPIVPHGRVFEALEAGEVDAALLIHEGRLTYEDRGLRKVFDLGEGWAAAVGGPLPLGANAIRRDLPADDLARISDLLRRSIAHGLADRDAAVAWLLARGGPLATAERVSRYLDLYANARTLDYGEDGRAAFGELYRRAVAAGLLASVPPLDFAP